jgi:hypothetical protein
LDGVEGKRFPLAIKNRVFYFILPIGMNVHAKRKWIGSLMALLVLTTLFHLLLIIKIIPYTITWGGRLKNDQEMYVFESISLVVNLFLLFLLSQKAGFIAQRMGNLWITFFLWIYIVLFTLNTVGNIFAKTPMEKSMALLTAFSAAVIFMVNRKEKTKTPY